MPRQPHTPPQLLAGPFRGAHAVTSGLITRRMLDGPSWVRLFPDVHAHRDTALDHRSWCLAAMLAAPAPVAIGGVSAAHLWGAAAPPGVTPVHVAAPRHYRSKMGPRLAVHSTTLAASDVTVLDGLRVTTAERTIFDLGRRGGRADTLAVLDAMLHRHLVDPDALQRMADRRSRWPGADRLAEVLRLADPRSESPMETRLRLLLHDAGVPAAVPQFEVRTRLGRLVGRVDLGWPRLRLAVEYDGDQHRERDQFRRDVERLNALRMAGWTVLRLTADDVLRRPAATARMVLAAAAELTASTSRP